MRNIAAKSLALVVVVVVGLLALSCAPAAPVPAPKPALTPAPAPAPKPAPATTPAPAPKKIVEVATPWGPAAGTAPAHGVVLSKMLKDHSTWLRGTPVFVTGFAKGVEYWEKGKDQGVFSLCFSGGMIADYVQGVRTYATQGPRKDQGLLWTVYVQDTMWVSRDGSPIKTMEDLKGSKIGFGEPGSSSMLIAKHIMEFGMEFKDTDYKAVYAAVADLVTLFKEGTIQVWNWTAPSAKGLPYSYLEDATNSVKSYFIPNTQAQVDKGE